VNRRRPIVHHLDQTTGENRKLERSQVPIHHQVVLAAPRPDQVAIAVIPRKAATHRAAGVDDAHHQNLVLPPHPRTVEAVAEDLIPIVGGRVTAALLKGRRGHEIGVVMVGARVVMDLGGHVLVPPTTGDVASADVVIPVDLVRL